jgi:hypothetical protein
MMYVVIRERWLAPLLVAVFVTTGCRTTGQEAESCDQEGLEVCSENGNVILICEDGKFRVLENCGSQLMVCEAGAEGPECVATNGDVRFKEQLQCAQDALFEFNGYLDILIHLLKEVDDPAAYMLPQGIGLNWETGVTNDYGEIGAELDLYQDGKLRSLDGIVRPKENCEDGMQEGDACVFEWSVVEVGSLAEVALGTMSGVDLGITGPPLNTTATRYTIVDRNPKITYSDACNIEITLFNMMWHLPLDDMYSFAMDFIVAYSAAGDTSRMTGSIIWGTTTGDPVVTFTSADETLDCAFDLDTLSFSCTL